MSNRKLPPAPTAPPIGRAALLAPTGPAPLDNARLVPIKLIDKNPHQPRQVFDPAALEALEASIREHGVLEPILVRPMGDRYLIIAGERRYRAATAAGLKAIPALVRDDLTDVDAAFITVLENLQRQDLDIEDEARQFAHLLALTGLSQRELARRLGIGFNYLSRRVRLLERPDLLSAVREGRLPLLEALKLMKVAGEEAETADLYLADTASNLLERYEIDELYLADTAEAEELQTGLYLADTDQEPEAATEVYLADTAAGSTATTPQVRRGTGEQQSTRWRYIEAAYRPLKHIQPAAIPAAERMEWDQQLADLESYIRNLRQAIAGE